MNIRLLIELGGLITVVCCLTEGGGELHMVIVLSLSCRKKYSSNIVVMMSNLVKEVFYLLVFRHLN